MDVILVVCSRLRTSMAKVERVEPNASCHCVGSCLNPPAWGICPRAWKIVTHHQQSTNHFPSTFYRCPEPRWSFLPVSVWPVRPRRTRGEVGVGGGEEGGERCLEGRLEAPSM
jgi:hypothetical protein